MFALTATPATPPPDNSVVAGPIGFTVFILLILATAFICWNFTKQLKKVDRAKERGVFGDEPTRPDADSTDSADSTDMADGSDAGDAATDGAEQPQPHDADA